jgi:SAM-dependent methyltransferase
MGPQAPAASRYTGIELMPCDVNRARQALGQAADGPRFVNGDMCETPLPPSDVVVIFDVLHYVDAAAQAALLRRVRDALVPSGRLLLRVGDLSQRRGFAISQWVDRLVTLARGHRAAPTFGRALPEWMALLGELGFVVHPLPMSRGTPFANVLLVADLGPEA